MRTLTRPAIVLLLAIGTAGAIQAQNIGAAITSNPMPAPIVKRGLAVEVRDLLRLPDTRGIRPADHRTTGERSGNPPPVTAA